ncbi:MAG: lactate utilization protein [Deltaproteobacteria bacterium]|nr:lactate utilization protein [Deltaproteobacteria bacterium]
MEPAIETYWQKRLSDVQKALEKNNFEVFLAVDAAEAKEIVKEKILPQCNAKTISWGGSLTFGATGLYGALKENADLEILDPFNRKVSPEKIQEMRKRAMVADLFITGSNSVTTDGKLVNLDMVGNRVTGITYGPKNVVILVGRNKIVKDLDAAMWRIKNFVAPVNAMRLNKKTPCVKTSYCGDCASPDRICNTWVITEKSFPKGRVKVVLINQSLGL